MSNSKDTVKKTLRESVESVIDESKVAEGKLPPWLEKKKKGKGKEEDMEEAKKSKEEDMEEAKAKKSDDEAEEMEEAKKKVVKEEECSCDEDDDLPYCDDCEDEEMEEAKKSEPKKMKEHLAPLFDGQELSEDF